MYKIILSLGAGAIYPLGFAPFNLWIFSIISVSILAHLFLSSNNAKEALLHGFRYGLGAFAVGVSWVYVSIHEFGHSDKFTSCLITAVFVAYLSIFPAIHGYLLKKLYKQAEPISFLLIIFPTSFVLIEILRSWLFSGFPWLLLGLTQLDTKLSSYIPISGVYGVSWLTAIISCSIVLCIRLKFTKVILPICLILSGAWIFSTQQWTKPNGKEHRIAFIQSNIKPDTKFLLEHPVASAWQLYVEPSLKIKKQYPDLELVVWPENSLPLPIPYAQRFINDLDNLAREEGFTIAFGVPLKLEHIYGKYLNSIHLVGNHHGTYFKRKLLPFGDFLPLESILRNVTEFFNLPMSSFIPGSAQQNDLIVNDSSLSPLICWEVAFSSLVKNSMVKNNSNAILVVSEDGWFGNSFGPYQHLEIARARALENGRFLLRSTTSGISAIINPQGKIESQTNLLEAAVLVGKYHDYAGQTPWMQIGLFPWVIFWLGLLLLKLFRA